LPPKFEAPPVNAAVPALAITALPPSLLAPIPADEFPPLESAAPAPPVVGSSDENSPSVDTEPQPLAAQAHAIETENRRRRLEFSTQEENHETAERRGNSLSQGRYLFGLSDSVTRTEPF